MKARKAFTLIELLTVVAIIGLLAGILLPAVSRARERGRMSRCENNLRQFGMSFLMYIDDHEKEYPDWLSNLYPKYIDNTNCYTCLSDLEMGLEGSKPDSMNLTGGEKQFKETNDTPTNPRGAGYQNRNQRIRACSYLYEFCNAECSWWNAGTGIPAIDADNDGVRSWGEVKDAQLKHGDSFHREPYDPTAFPIIRCFHHREERRVAMVDASGRPTGATEPLTMNVAYAGNVFRAGLYWELSISDL